MICPAFKIKVDKTWFNPSMRADRGDNGLKVSSFVLFAGMVSVLLWGRGKRTNQQVVYNVVEKFFETITKLYEQLGQIASVCHRMVFGSGVYDCSRIEVFLMLYKQVSFSG